MLYIASAFLGFENSFFRISLPEQVFCGGGWLKAAWLLGFSSFFCVYVLSDFPSKINLCFFTWQIDTPHN